MVVYKRFSCSVVIYIKRGCRLKFFVLKLHDQLQTENPRGVLNWFGWQRGCVFASTVSAVQFHVYRILQRLKSTTTHSETSIKGIVVFYVDGGGGGGRC